jgi:hypothetical protein
LSVSSETCYHEAGHAVAAIRLGIGLAARGIEVNSDSDATTFICEPPSAGLTEDYSIRRAAAKLAGPAAECRRRDQVCNEEILKTCHRYAADYNEARKILQKHQTDAGVVMPDALERWLDCACQVAANIIGDQWEEIVR